MLVVVGGEVGVVPGMVKFCNGWQVAHQTRIYSLTWSHKMRLALSLAMTCIKVAINGGLATLWQGEGYTLYMVPHYTTDQMLVKCVVLLNLFFMLNILRLKLYGVYGIAERMQQHDHVCMYVNNLLQYNTFITWHWSLIGLLYVAMEHGDIY